MPAVAASASWLETFKMPLREIKKKFTLSEMAIMSWRSKEMSASLTKGRTESKSDHIKLEPVLDNKLQHVKHDSNATRVIEHEDSYELPKEVNNGVPIPKTFFNTDGDIDLSQVTGPQAVRYLRAVGINIPTIFR